MDFLNRAKDLLDDDKDRKGKRQVPSVISSSLTQAPRHHYYPAMIRCPSCLVALAQLRSPPQTINPLII